MLRAVAVYAHPLAGLVTIALAAYLGSLGFRSRLPRLDAATCRHRHAALAPWVYVLFLLNWAGGFATVWAVRDEIEPADSGHFTVGALLVAVLTATALVSRRVRDDDRARLIHPLLGAAALLLCGFQLFLGMQLLP